MRCTKSILAGLIGLAIALIASSAASYAQSSTESREADEQQQDGEWKLNWPREFTDKAGNQLVLYQPQVDDWKDYQVLNARLAAAYTAKGSQAQELGVVTLSAKTETDLDTREVAVHDITIEEIAFPDLDRKALGRVAVQIGAMLPKDPIVISVDRVTAALERTEAANEQAALNEKAPPIFVSQAPAILVMFDGEPIMAPLKKSKLQFAVNTNWDLFYLKDENTYWMRDEDGWLQTSDLKGDWQPAGALPKELSNLPNDDNWKEVKANIPGKPIKKNDLPTIFVSFEPAELITLFGKPDFKKVPNTNLSFISNTESTVVRDNATGLHYFLVSGRWFSAKTLEGPWIFASGNLPEDFQKIPEDGDLGDILASVPGTEAAQEAVILASIPQKARVERKGTTINVTYDGDPKFVQIKGANLRYAVNTSFTVILASNGKYYAVHKGVWFVSSSPNGPWVVASNVPAEIYTIPASSPVHNVTYVRIYESHPTHVVCGYTAGYWGATVAYGAIMYGTGWWHPPYYYWGNYPGYYYRYPVYRPYPTTYGLGAYYNPVSGSWGRGGYAYGPYRGIGAVAGYNPRTGTYYRGAGAYGPHGARGWVGAYNPRTGVGAVSRGGANVYGSWRSTTVRKGTDWVHSRSARGDKGAAARWQTSRGNQGFAGKTKHGDLYAGRNGSVYKRGSDGNWQKVSRSGTTPLARSSDGKSRLKQKQPVKRQKQVRKEPAKKAKQKVRKQKPKTTKKQVRKQKPKTKKKQVRKSASKSTRKAKPRKRTTKQNLNRAQRKRQTGQKRVSQRNSYKRSTRSGGTQRYRGGGHRGGGRRGGRRR